MKLLSCKNLVVEFGAGKNAVTAVDNISFDIEEGESLALVGESGCGKSTTALALMGLSPGRVRFGQGGGLWLGDTDLAALSRKDWQRLRGDAMAMIFQEPMTALNPLLTICDQVGEPLEIHKGMTRRAARKRVIELLESVGIGNAAARVDEFPHMLSGGMRQRVMIAMALACKPRLIIADEPTTALDVTIQAQVMELFSRLRSEVGAALLLITHDMGVVAQNVDRVAVMYTGRIVEQGAVSSVFNRPAHPYTIGLLGAIAEVGVDAPRAARGSRLLEIPGVVPALNRMPRGCSFAERCPIATDICRESVPQLKVVGEGGHRAACFHGREGLTLP